MLVTGGEKHLLSYMESYSIKAVCLRYCNVYGENRRLDACGNAIPIFAGRIARGEGLTIFGDGEQTRDFISIKDMAAENLQAWGTFNVGTGTEILGEATGENFEVVYGSPRPGDGRHCTADSTRLRGVLGILPSTDIPENLKNYYTWMTSDPVSIENILSVETGRA